MNLLERVINTNFYSGVRKKRKVSVSEISSKTFYQSYLLHKHGTVEKKRATQATLGQIFDIGMRELIKGWGYESGERFTVNIGETGWVLSGEFDALDTEMSDLYDFKLTKTRQLMECAKNRQESGYWIQLNYYRLMLFITRGLVINKMYLFMGLKDQALHDGAKTPSEAIVLQEVGEIGFDDLKDWAVSHVNRLEHFLYGEGKDEEPEVCIKDDRWFRDMRCKYYCDVSEHCAHAKKYKYNGVKKWA